MQKSKTQSAHVIPKDRITPNDSCITGSTYCECLSTNKKIKLTYHQVKNYITVLVDPVGYKLVTFMLPKERTSELVLRLFDTLLAAKALTEAEYTELINKYSNRLPAPNKKIKVVSAEW